ncbi:hypothetical protein [Hugenholtzia roseola]|uniref:hypothetical protein n=1 Tax=Hugenholtzia roseola TaxID=1002 RepID=UPI00047A5E50|nr:hypothetical protein [Hugenholtzia roseola]
MKIDPKNALTDAKALPTPTTYNERLHALACLGERIKDLVAMPNLLEAARWVGESYRQNAWFTPSSLAFALSEWAALLDPTALEAWVAPYRTALEKADKKQMRKVGLIAAGNIPLVAFHDWLAIFVSGNQAQVKLSSKDTVLLPALLEILVEIFPTAATQIQFFPHLLKEAHAYIATGSDNSTRYFAYYFDKYPHLIRSNRTSIAVLQGNESAEDLANLHTDIFTYFGLGCRNVSKIFVPEGYDFNPLLDIFYEKGKDLMQHNKYANNYDYNKAVYLMNQIPHLDAGTCLIKHDEGLFSPTAVLYAQTYRNQDEVENFATLWQNKIQCRVGKGGLSFGTAQKPRLNDYADNLDTMDFLLNLKNEI